MAEGLLREMLRRHQVNEVRVLSAGVSAPIGRPPTEETVQVMKREGIDVSGHLSRPLTPELVETADAIFCMEQAHRRDILAVQPEAEPKTHLLRSFRLPGGLADADIPDPIGQPESVYTACLETLKEAVGRVADWILREPPRG